MTTTAFIGLGALVHLHYMSPYLLVNDEGTRTLSPTEKLENVSFLASFTPWTRLCQAGHTPWILHQKLAAQIAGFTSLTPAMDVAMVLAPCPVFKVTRYMLRVLGPVVAGPAQSRALGIIFNCKVPKLELLSELI